MPGAPRTDPYERNSRIRLLPRMHDVEAYLPPRRTPSNPRDSRLVSPARLSVRCEGVCSMFSLVGGLPSRSSASAVVPPLFGPFVGTTPPSDSPEPCMSAVWLTPSPPGPLPNAQRAVLGSPGSRAWSIHACAGSRTAQRPWTTRDNVARVWPSGSNTPSARWRTDFAAQYPAYRCPCQRFDG